MDKSHPRLKKCKDCGGFFDIGELIAWENDEGEEDLICWDCSDKRDVVSRLTTNQKGTEMRKEIRIDELIKHLQVIRKKHGDLECIYASDDEGNSFHSIYYQPCIGTFTQNHEFYSDGVEFGNGKLPINAVCIN